MKLRLKLVSNNQLFRLQVEQQSTLLFLKQEVAKVVGEPNVENIQLSLNKRDILEAEQDAKSLSDIGICSGELLWIHDSEITPMKSNQTSNIKVSNKSHHSKNISRKEECKFQNNRPILNLQRQHLADIHSQINKNNHHNNSNINNKLEQVVRILMLEAGFTETVNDLSRSQAGGFWERSFELQQSSDKCISVVLQCMIFGLQWIQIIGKIEQNVIINYKSKLNEEVIQGLYFTHPNNFVEQDEQQEFVRKLKDGVVIALVLRCCVELDIVYPYSLSALSTDVKRRIIHFISEGTTLIRLQSTCKELDSLIRNNDLLWQQLLFQMNDSVLLFERKHTFKEMYVKNKFLESWVTQFF
eukprot:TRINITY_DN69627_c0_g1_i1.p1 TRINITY_DN69627_c0_g1~~TRINITY_DN69627_c0_g1_i1.p1  ORF type:complete len:371 (-),score=35.34 TRINITY_DN69627_c0_g1_i1:205-1272(-)